jgi:hypothetical protein
MCVYSMPSWHSAQAQTTNMYVRLKMLWAMSRIVQVDICSHGWCIYFNEGMNLGFF